jgi:hypothetical protein
MKMDEARPSRRETMDEERALKLAETTDLSPRQALLLIQRYGDDEQGLMEAVRNFKAES